VFKGIFSDLGLGNVLGGKSPLDWGITKILGGLAGWGIGESNAWSGMGQGGQGALGGPAGGGILDGHIQTATGLKLPKSGVPLGPSAVSGVAPSISSGQGAGPAPGPVDSSINFSVTQNGVKDGTTEVQNYVKRHRGTRALGQSAGHKDLLMQLNQFQAGTDDEERG
jgi:hypothetical protein